MKLVYLYLSIALMISGGVVNYTNFDRETITLTPELDEVVLLDYHAPRIDPFAHHLILDVETSAEVEVSEIRPGETNFIFANRGQGKFTVESGQNIELVLRNPNASTGTVKTTFYCDSWTYTSYALVLLGAIFSVVWYVKSGEAQVEEL